MQCGIEKAIANLATPHPQARQRDLYPYSSSLQLCSPIEVRAYGSHDIAGKPVGLRGGHSILFYDCVLFAGLVLPFVAALLALFLIDMESALYFALPLASGALFGWRGKRQGKEWQGAMLGHENVEKKGGEGQVARERGGGGASVSGEVGTDGAGGGAQEGGREGAAGTREDSSPRGLAGCFKALGREVSGALRWRPGSWRVAAVVTALAGVTGEGWPQ